MYVEAQESKYSGLPFLCPEREGHDCDDQSEHQVVKRVVI
jgi:hypothetical protein